MPKAFSESERGALRAKLIETGRRILNRRGIKGMSVDEVAKAAGIAKGSFYGFFPSKEVFVLRVLESWEDEFRTAAFERAFAPGGAPRECLRRLFAETFVLMEKEPGLAGMAAGGVAAREARSPPEELEAHRARDDEFRRRFFADAAARGIKRPVDEATLRGLFMAPFFLSLHREEFGERSWKAFADAFADMASAWLGGEEEDAR